MRKLFLLFCLAASSASSAKVSESLGYTHYEAKAAPGLSLAAILNQSSPYRPDGQVFHSSTSWNVDWKFQQSARRNGRCRIVGVATHLTGTIDLPRLIGAEARMAEQFEDYLAALRFHELGHYAIGKQAAVAVDSRLRSLPEMADCRALESAARTLGARILQEYEAKGLEYDAKTGHGKTQGAWLGP